MASLGLLLRRWMLCWKNSNIQSLVFRMSFVEPEFITFIFTFNRYFKTTKMHQVGDQNIFWNPANPLLGPGKIRGSPAVLCRDGARSLGWFFAGDETKPVTSSVTEFPYVSWLRSDITVTERNLKKCVFFFGWRVSFHETCDWTKWWKKRWVCHFQNKLFVIVIEKTCFLVWKCIGIWVVDSSWIQ